ncbi:MAG: putative sugar nucleotidyl transferase [Planctomycetota bacterium]|nr:putative sugar nucleotidyl transferase [Planctomycetota bacterium]
MNKCVLFDDGRSNFGPLSETRCSFEQRAGAFTNIERAQRIGLTLVGLVCDASHRARVDERWGSAVSSESSETRVLAINGLASLAQMREAIEMSVAETLVDPSGRLVAVRCEQGRLDAIAAVGWTPATGASPRISAHSIPVHPWDLLNQLRGRLEEDLALRVSAGDLDPLNVHGGRAWQHPRTIIEPGVIIDARLGTVIIDEGAVIEMNAVIRGPAMIGPQTIISPQSLIKGSTVIGPNCRIGGEVGGCIIQGHSNKVHDGHLGDSMVGEWVNIGAGACNSNLLNTYGEVIASLGPNESRVATGRTHYGGVIGDHAKIAILVALPTGMSIGVGAMVALSRAPQTIGSFTWLTPDRHASYRFDRFMRTEEAMMARRGVTMGSAMRVHLEHLHGSATSG